MLLTMCSVEQVDELEAIQSIFDEEFTHISTDPPCFMIQIDDSNGKMKGALQLKITFPENYPDSVPIIEIPNRSQMLKEVQHRALLDHMYCVAEECKGLAMVFTLVESMKEWIDQNFEEEPEVISDQEHDVGPQKMCEVHIKEPKHTGGRWDLVLGLVGKPSAGKSTFFNAATAALEMAKTGAHPFTTIEPNIGKAFYSVPCPCQKMEKLCDAAYGHNSFNERLLPVLLKDVAGLVPGACEGKGRGNRFLNDLCDADVLIHIVDVSGNTNEKGELTSGYNPANDIVWLQQEIEQWIHGNIMEKWDSIRRKPTKLIDMFTGYHATKATIFFVLQSAGIGDSELGNLANWNDSVLRSVVKQFVNIRFPIYLVLNKADVATGEENITRIKEAFPDIPGIAVCSWGETLLQDFHRRGAINYVPGSAEVTVLSSCSHGDRIKIQDLQNQVLTKYGATNVLRALSAAIAMKPPAYAFPVVDLDTWTSIDKYKGESPGMLRDCVIVKPGTTCEELYQVMLYEPISLVAGDFIRAECLSENGDKRIMKKLETVGEHNANSQTIVKVMTTRKVTPCKRR